MKKNARDTLAAVEPMHPVDIPTLCIAAEIPVEVALARKSVQAGPFMLPLRREYLAQLSASRVRVLGKYTHPGTAPAGAPRMQLTEPTEEALTQALERLAMQQALDDAQVDKRTLDWRRAVDSGVIFKTRQLAGFFHEVVPPVILQTPLLVDATTLEYVRAGYEKACETLRNIRKCAVLYALAKSGQDEPAHALQFGRLKDGFMHWEQQADLVRAYLFAPYAPFQRAERIPRLRELAEDGIKVEELAVVDVVATTLSDKAYAQLKAVAAVPHPKAIATDDLVAPRVDVDPMIRQVFPKPPNGAPAGSYGQKPLAERLIARVTITWHGWAVHRDYSLE